MPNITNSNLISDGAQINPGIIENSDVSATAAIAYSKLNLALGIVNADVSASAAIVDTKLAQIATASKVSGAALTSLTSIPSGAGKIPSANLSTAVTHTTGTLVIAQSLTEVTEQNTGWVKRKEVKIGAVAAGVVSVAFDLKDEASGGAQGQIYVNGSAVGTLRNNAGNIVYVTFTEDITVVSGDLVQLYYNNTVANKQVYIKNFKVMAAAVEVTTTIT